MNKISMAGIALAIILGACSKEQFEASAPDAVNTQAVNIHIDYDFWDETCGTRAGDGLSDDMLTPVTLLLVPADGSKAVSRKVVYDDDFSIAVPQGTYDIFAVCGLPEDNVPDDVFEEISIPSSTTGSTGLMDFAVGSASIANEYGKDTPSSVSITAKRQLAWLTITISDVPDYFASLSMYVKGLGETYNLAEKWTVSEEAKNNLTHVILARKPGKKIHTRDIITNPCTDATSGTVFVIEGKTADKTLTYTYTSANPLAAGKHLTINLKVSDLVKVRETINIENWDNKEENGTLENPTVTSGS